MDAHTENRTDGADDTAAPRLVDVDEQPLAVVVGSVRLEELRGFFDSAFRELGERMAAGDVVPAGPALALYRSAPAETVDLEVGFVVREPVAPAGAVVAGRLPATRAVTAVHHGNYDGLGEAWARLRAWAEDQGITLGAPLWEVYVTEPHPGDDPRDMVTELYWAAQP
ncbi:GyrI-like domain-containing protein [Kocuria rosea]|jgi:effector-binding domain-containing protein|uniref:GyrI-like domain-containing protein n=1 Tax=Kocuria rosea TaxID=1275 RepID=UPI00203BF017|nr:GyrI-like domain-containing protein [Kocuria rosea]MCM3689536.1 GyrI-like domain-containing protein [Kocuria rosea]